MAGTKPTCIAWLTEPQAALVRDVAGRAGLEVVGAGSPVRGQSAAVAQALHAPPHDDLRATLASAEADLVLVAAPGEFGGRAAEDTAAILAARARGTRIATLEPLPSSALDLASGAWRVQSGADPVDAVRFHPLARLSRPYREAMDVLESFGPVRTLTVCVDGWRSTAPILELSSIDIRSVALIELYDISGIKLYTDGWMEARAAAGRVSVFPDTPFGLSCQ